MMTMTNPLVVPIQRDCPRAACAAMGIQCKDRREGRTCESGYQPPERT
ncbi:hypothetical protein PBI_CATERA_21 [Mycobacterium phage Catera]|uniref:Uncharacterized protein n=18 Tax=Bixzunavirus TaxID=680114 RepID=Q853Q3_BPMBZ|nr:gp24 [Mycobacterium phage Bxz1]YP_002224279.1 gp25 [Mycobacterium phage Spud]YP_002224719.1 gp21 [Mycobacterium phage Rizal]YP_009221152.1 hypothetical protein AWH68_gp022 [Mycobacterium phage Breeniome]YP_010057665.1 hypothetical protein KHO61_gp025 [Mycobacterium phage Mangeria]YP_010058345.1 hypothetical protein KHO64_gp021 [Mycobacterium phage Quasimodo]YP_656034.1 gp21 [Mycobacterium phage Catera]AEJ94887.1 hypothetical protein GHOST_22 [Mycobacterium phage Ghost]AEK06836.1 hypothet